MVFDASFGVNSEVKVTEHGPREREVTTRVRELASSVTHVHANRGDKHEK